MSGVVADVLGALNWTVLGYVVVLDAVVLLLVVAAARRVLAHRRWSGTEGHDQLFASPLTPAVSVLVTAHDEEARVLDTLAAALAQRYPAFEVVLVDDGSTDGTFDLVARTYGLVPVTARWSADLPVEGEVLSVHRATTGDPLTVVRKVGVGRPADAVNAALNLARHRLVCTLDAGAVLEPDALLTVVRPFVEDPLDVVAAGGVVRTLNGSRLERGSVLEPGLPKRWLARVQVLEQLRSALLSRAGRTGAHALLADSGAFGLFRRDLLLELGGVDPRSATGTADLVVALHGLLRRTGRPHRMVFVPEPVCWTTVPETWEGLGRRHRRRSQGLGQLLWKHRRMIANPRYGAVGVLTLPALVLLEVLGPAVEVLGLVSVAVAAATGALDRDLAVVLAGFALLVGISLSTTVVAVEEFTSPRRSGRRDLPALLVAGLLRNVGFRQVHAWYRFQGLLLALTRRDGRAERRGLRAEPPRPVGAGTVHGGHPSSRPAPRRT
ncbi:glycosyltransferase family 2 protein [Kineococcus rhizosphaerae]|uniref:Cellulose synthase/poly-beta-1,6-N-acetylglucosamine synthase-like glycosyltransferase n=1 Tax=Kineococcus rhizosphaerae TaxID=559628 RepID=A0A2T0R4W2_9ACTN|nr:glycosyltransferase family 2 protein [Kineococcus rhizosphaerae]PRY15813.1 cellulose synthase/poly-beta-1,6-N-acetylglucosamine synthase-like glycosyltransferase [Kineococcus rhizosphaerae]